MAGTGSPMPFIKNEPDDQNFGLNAYGSMNSNGQQYGSWQGSMPNADVTDLNLNGGLTRPSFGSSQHLSSHFIAGSSALDDDDLTADFIDYESNNNDNSNNSSGNNNMKQNNHSMHIGDDNYSKSQPQFSNNQGFYNQMQQNSLRGNQPGSYLHQMYSNTPPGNGPIQSPFVNSFNYSQWPSMQSHHQQRMAQHHQSSSPNVRNGSLHNRPSMRNGRNSSDARSPMTPRTPGLGNMHISTPEQNNFDGQGIPVNQTSQGHRQSASTQWDSGISSGHSFLESPMSSPLAGPAHPPISSVMESGKHASLPTKSEFVASSVPTTNAEAKKRRRRESHNAVERRRRDNINDRIQELARLVPPHRLEDDRLRKHLSGSAPFPVSGNSMSPPQATSLLAGGTGRRAAGSITQGIPIDDKDKNPAKGDVLNGAVTWTRDLMWMLHRKLQQESLLLETIESLGGQPPYEMRDDEQRMQTELLAAIERNDAANFEYSRTDGSGLFVPKHTDTSGAPISASSQQNFDCNFQPSGPGSTYAEQDAFSWEYNPDNESARGSMDFKEEDEFGMDMG